MADLPLSLQHSIVHDIADFTIGFFKIVHSDNQLAHRPLGSGTLVSATKSDGNRVYAILTACHVVDVLPADGELMLALGHCSVPSVVLKPEDRRYKKFPRGAEESRGPDLGVVVLSPIFASSLAAKRLFLDLDQQLEEMQKGEPRLEDGIWVIQGMLEERTKTELVDGCLKILGYNFTGIGTVTSRQVVGEFDYYEFPVDFGEDIPNKYQGMSGGGLWQVQLSRQNGTIVHKTPMYSGVLFYQQMINDQQCLIRCHGRQSCYVKARDWLKNQA